MTAAQTHIVAQLQQSIRHLESVSRADEGSVVSSGCPAIDQALPSGGYRRGTLIEWIAPSFSSCPSPSNSTGRSGHVSGGHGLNFISLLAAQQACKDGGALVIADPHRQFYPVAATAMGISLSNLIILRCPTHNPAVMASSPYDSDESDEPDNGLFWAIDQALRCSAVAAVWGVVDHINERWFRRFQLSAESSGALGLFVRPSSAAKQPSWAEVQWATHTPRHLGTPPVQSIPGSELKSCPKKQARSVLLQLVRCRGGKTGATLLIEIDTLTGNVHGQNVRRENDSTLKNISMSLASQLAHPTPRRKAARA